jgi:phosphoglycolate phosphatase/AHBA synthesis associated protein
VVVPPPRAVLFDMDGVLVKSWEAWFRCVEEAGLRFRGRAITREEFAPTFGQGTRADLGVFGLSCTVAELDAHYVESFLRHVEHVWVNPEAAPLLETLRGRGVARALVTNTVGPLTDKVIARAKLTEMLPVRATADRVANAKPAPDLVRLALAEVGVSAGEAWLVGDSRYDREAARAAGVRFVGLGIDGDARIEALADLLGLPGLAPLRSP